mmetsp:Transcript_1991/g.6071  ORF Transcript_1991/g.6071 Transcript_1991/m.6071 type:complete len:246 (-) Transcript_1991:34-771(-)
MLGGGAAGGGAALAAAPLGGLGAQICDRHRQLLAAQRRDDVERRVHVLLCEGEEQLPVDSVLLEGHGVLAQLLLLQPLQHVRHLPGRWVGRVHRRGQRCAALQRRLFAHERHGLRHRVLRFVHLRLRLLADKLLVQVVVPVSLALHLGLRRLLLRLDLRNLRGQRLVLDRPAEAEEVVDSEDRDEPGDGRVGEGEALHRLRPLLRRRAHPPPLPPTEQFRRRAAHRKKRPASCARHAREHASAAL